MKIPSLICLTFLLLSCEIESIVITDENFKSELVILCLFQPGDSISLTLQSTKIDGSGSYVKGAEVAFYEDDNLIGRFYEIGDLTGFYPSTYVLQHPITAGKKYRVESNEEGFEPVWAESTIPPVSKILDSGYELSPNPALYHNSDIPIYREVDVFLEFEDTEREDYYEIFVGYQDSIFQILPFEFIGINSYEPNWGLQFDLVQSYFISPLNNKSLNRIDIYERSIPTKPFRVDLQHIVTGKNWFFEHTEEVDAFHILDVKLRTITPEFYRYQRTLSLQNQTQDDPFAEYVRIEGNIHGGQGIFAGYNESSVLLPIGWEWYEPN